MKPEENIAYFKGKNESKMKINRMKKQIEELKKQNNMLETEKEQLNNLVNSCQEEIRKLKKHLEVPETCSLKTLEDYKNYYEDTAKEEILEDTYIDYCAYVNLAHKYSELKKQKEEWINLLSMFKNQQKEFIEYIDNEKDRLARECSQIYEDSLGKTRLVNEDIFNEVDKILLKYQEIIGGKE